MKEIIYKAESYKIIGACMEVHNELGQGFHEVVYQEALKNELTLQQIPFEKEKKLNILYKGKFLNKYYDADYICFDKIILEIKAVSALIPEHVAQVVNYLKTTNFKLGILVNFGEESLTYKRIPNKYYKE